MYNMVKPLAPLKHQAVTLGRHAERLVDAKRHNSPDSVFFSTIPLPGRSAERNSGASMGLLASTKIRPLTSGRPESAAGNFDQGTATSIMS
jgi:hypothetical protein